MGTHIHLPKFDSPPVVETVLGAQFSPVSQFNEVHAGWLWKKYFSDEWIRTSIAPRLEDQFERFGDEKLWGPEALLMVRAATGGERVQIYRSDDERMIQVQNTRFLYNWRKGSAGYPSYDKLLPEFKDLFASFEQFVKEAAKGELTLNQWEVTYVNQIPKGDLWFSASDWPSIFPWFVPPATNIQGQHPDGFRGEWSLVVGDNLGRLHISLKHVRVGSSAGKEALALQLTARGPLGEGKSLEVGLNIGHESIVESFAAITSQKAHKHWRRTA
ncbi:MAG: TIGR04255 family protein [Gammaproteobacteria bacterium]